MHRKGIFLIFFFLTSIILIVAPLQGITPKKTKTKFDNFIFISPELKVSEIPITPAEISLRQEGFNEFRNFLNKLGPEWSIMIDVATGRPSIIQGGAIPFIPGPANNLSWGEFLPGCISSECLTLEVIEEKAKEWLYNFNEIFKLDGYELKADPNGSGPVGDHLYFIRFQPYFEGIPLQGASIYFRINNGNLIQVGCETFGDVFISPNPSIDPGMAWEILYNYIGHEDKQKDRILDEGTLIFVPFTPKDFNPEIFQLSFGKGISYKLVYRLVFQRQGVLGTWEVYIDAQSGEILKFVDKNIYGTIKGGIYPNSIHDTEIIRPFSYADYGPEQYSNGGGVYNFERSSVSTLKGKYIQVIPGTCNIYEDMYGDPDGHPIYLEANANPGDLDFKTGDIPVSHENGGCVTPSPKNYGGEGNTVGARTSYFHLTKGAEKLLGYNLPGTSRLFNPPLNVYPHILNPGENFYDSTTNAIFLGFHGTNGNIFHGEDSATSAGIVLHEMGHSIDYFDGSGGMSNPAEAFADISTMFMTHDSCIGRGFLLDCIYDQNGTCLTPLETYRLCYGYGNPCTSCDGGRDIDYAKHSSPVPSTPVNFVDPYCTQDPYGYNGPCGYEQHCEATIATQAMWDLATRDLPPVMDTPTAWQFAERLFFLGAPTLGNFYGNCSYRNVTNTNGCNAGSLYNVLRAIDDDGDGTGNGTPHAAEIYAALNRHRIACTTAGSNDNYTTCPTISKPTGLSATYSSNKVVLTWNSVQNASKYEILRAELGCNSSFNKIAEVSAPITTYTDTEVANNFEYYYRIWAVGSNPSCRSLVSDCVNVTPLPCNGDLIVEERTYSCNDKIDIYLEDSDIKGAGSVNLIAWSEIEPNPENIVLTENPSNSGKFYGSINTSTSGAHGDGAIGVVNNSTITIRYQDSNSCGSGQQNKDKTINIDCAPPYISNLQVLGITDEEATVSFTTSEPANCKVVYGNQIPPGKYTQETEEQYTTYHLINLKDLSACTTYYFNLILMDKTGNIFIDNNGGNYYTFKTKGRQYLFRDDMENGSSNWIRDGDGYVCDMSNPYQWYLLQNCKQHSGSYAWRAGDETCQDPFCWMRCSHWLEMANPVNLGTGGWRLRWKEWYRTFENLRQQYVFITTNGGITWNIIGVNYGGTLPKYTGPESFIHRDEDISSYTGNAKIRFRFEEYDFYSLEGWYIDDVDISKVVPCDGLPELQYQSFTKTDLCNGTGSGGGNGYIEPGEDINLTLTIKNIGNSTATGVYATISSIDPGVIITDPTASFPDIPAGQTGTALDTVSFRLNPSIPCGSVITINIRMSCTQGYWDDSFRIYVGQGTLTVNEYIKSYPYPYLALSDAGSTSSTITVTGNPGLVTRVEVYIGFISHYRDEDLDIYLVGPNNVKVELSTDNGGRMNDYLNTYFRDDYITPIESGTPPFTGYFKPEGSLSAFIGIPANGNWRLEIVDDTYGYSGRLFEWGIALETTPNPPVCAGCSPNISGTPNIVYMSRGSFIEISGDGDSYFDKGEKWSVQVYLTNNGTATATNVQAKLSGDGITVCSPGYFGTITPGGNASYTYEFVISSDFQQCGGEIKFNVIDKTSNEITPAGWNEYSVFKIQNVGKQIQAPLTNEELGRTGTIPGRTTTYFYTAEDPVTSTPATIIDCKVDISLTPPCPSKGGTITVVVEHDPGNDGNYEYTQTVYSGNPQNWSDVVNFNLNNMVGSNGNGKWRIRVTHSVSGQCSPAGTMNSWKLKLIINGNAYDCSYIGNGSCSSGCTNPSQPVITQITDVDPNSQSGIRIYYNPGWPATRHDLYRDGVRVVAGYVSGAVYNPQDALSHDYLIRAVNISDYCFRDSNPQGFRDNPFTCINPSTPIIGNIIDNSFCGFGITIPFQSGSPSTRNDLYVDGVLVQSGVISPVIYYPSDNNSHSYKIRSIYGNESCYTESAISNFTDLNYNVGVPSNITIEDIEPCVLSGVRIYWDSVSGATSYDIRVGQSTDFFYNKTSPFTYYPDNNLPRNYYVRAKNSYCTGEWSESVSGTDGEGTPPGTPVIGTITDASGECDFGISIPFTLGSGAIRHDLYVDGKLAKASVSSPVSYIPSDTNSHNYVIRAYSAGSCYVNSSPSSFSDTNNTPSAPVINSVQDYDPNECNGVLITFNQGTPSTQHNLLKDGSPVAYNISSPYLYNPGDSDLHNYVVRAINGNCQKDSNIVQGADLCGGCTFPTQKVLIIPNGNGFSWNLTDAQRYRVLRGTQTNLPALLTNDPDFTCYAFGNFNSIDISSDDPSSVPGNCYYYLVQGYNCNDPDNYLGPVGDSSSGPRYVNTQSPCN